MNPNVDDLDALGSGNETYNEAKNGLIVLDECGTWLNTREWQDKSRQNLIDWMPHSRKKGWDIILIVQDLALIDKQVRTAKPKLQHLTRKSRITPSYCTEARRVGR